jgi:hypothetical protein
VDPADLPLSLPADLRLPVGFPLAEIVRELRSIGGLVAVVLGGSWAAGRARPDSDVDLGLYYRAARPLDVDGVRRAAERLNDAPGPVVTPLGGWGPWVNGGAWLTIRGRRCDLLYRDLDRVTATVDEVLAGGNRSDYWQQAPYGFHSPIYCAEVRVARPLHDPEGVVAALKERVAVYPELVKRRRVSAWLWGADFTLRNEHGAAERGEAYLVAGYLTRAATEMVQALYALNETWFMHDKYVYRDVAEFRIVPRDFMARIDTICGGPLTPSDPRRRLHEARALHAELLALAGDLYAPRGVTHICSPGQAARGRRERERARRASMASPPASDQRMPARFMRRWTT